MKPNVLCIGFAKCGTTTFHDIMKQHKDIYLSGIKEPAYYNMKKFYTKGFDWYQKRYYPKKVKEKIIMEVNPLIAKHVKADTIKKDYGNDTKIIILIREPVERLYSNFKMNLVSGACFKTYEESIGASTSKLFNNYLNIYYDKEKKQFSECVETHIVANGEYYNVIKDYINVFGKNNVKVILFEEFIKEPHKICQEVYKLIDIEDDDNINYNIHSNEGGRLPRNKFTIKLNRWYFYRIYNSIIIPKLPYISTTFSKMIDRMDWSIRKKILSKKDKQPEKMMPNDKKMLQDYYYSDIKKLSKLLKIDLVKKWKME